MPGLLHQFFETDHARLDELLRRAAQSREIDLESYEEFRTGLLRHIAMEEQVLFREVRGLHGEKLVPGVRQARADHAALAVLLVPPPTHELLATIQQVLSEHNPIEEKEPGGIYELCEQHFGPRIDEIITQLREFPIPNIARHKDDPHVHKHIQKLMRLRRTVAP